MIVKPTVTELLKKAKNRYELVIATSKRARQIAMGDEPLTKVKEESPVTLAANEIAEGKVEIIRDIEELKKIKKEELEESETEEVQKEVDDETQENLEEITEPEQENAESNEDTKSKKKSKTKKEE